MLPANFPAGDGGEGHRNHGILIVTDRTTLNATLMCPVKFSPVTDIRSGILSGSRPTLTEFLSSDRQRFSPRAEGHLFAGNDQVFNWYFWKGPTLGYSK